MRLPIYLSICLFPLITCSCSAHSRSHASQFAPDEQPPLYGSAPVESGKNDRVSSVLKATTQATSTTKEVGRPSGGWSGRSEVYEEGDFVLNGVPLDKALAVLVERSHGWSGIHRINVEWEALAGVGITRSSGVTVKLWSPKVCKVLEAMMESARPGSKTDLEFLNEGNSNIRITTRNLHLSRDGLNREYNLHQLFLDIPDEPERDKHEGGLFGNQPRTKDDRKNAIVQLIKETVDPDSWIRTEACSIRFVGEVIAVHQVEENLRSIENLIEQLTETRHSDVLNARVRPTTMPTTKLVSR